MSKQAMESEPTEEQVQAKVKTVTLDQVDGLTDKDIIPNKMQIKGKIFDAGEPYSYESKGMEQKEWPFVIMDHTRAWRLRVFQQGFADVLKMGETFLIQNFKINDDQIIIDKYSKIEQTDQLEIPPTAEVIAKARQIREDYNPMEFTKIEHMTEEGKKLNVKGKVTKKPTMDSICLEDESGSIQVHLFGVYGKNTYKVGYKIEIRKALTKKKGGQMQLHVNSFSNIQILSVDEGVDTDMAGPQTGKIIAVQDVKIYMACRRGKCRLTALTRQELRCKKCSYIYNERTAGTGYYCTLLVLKRNERDGKDENGDEENDEITLKIFNRSIDRILRECYPGKSIKQLTENEDELKSNIKQILGINITFTQDEDNIADIKEIV